MTTTSEDITLLELEPSWKKALASHVKQPYIAPLCAFVEQERTTSKLPVYPPKELVLNALWQTPYDKVKVVIVGQDPYHGPGQAHGLSFSVPKGVPSPPSLQNIFKEIVADVGGEMPSHGCLMDWATQGVLLLNATLTVRQGEPMSHHGKGWEKFTDAIIATICERRDPVVFVLWGKSAQEKCKNIELNSNHPHLILKAPHPSPFSAHQGFFGCRHFSKINEFLRKLGKSEIKWI
jgi:uracil-DNA glycosylase